jgi:hypothetical protein
MEYLPAVFDSAKALFSEERAGPQAMPKTL